MTKEEKRLETLIDHVEQFFRTTAKDKVTDEEREIIALAREGLAARFHLAPALVEIVSLHNKVDEIEDITKLITFKPRAKNAWKKADSAITEWLKRRFTAQGIECPTGSGD